MTEAKPAGPAQAARQALVTLRTRVDRHFDAAVAAQPEAFACAAGCSACCHQRFGVFEIEAEAIRRALGDMASEDPSLRATVRRQASDPATQHHCALLVNDRCTVYEARPLICRSHGLALRVEAQAPDERPQIDHCPLNFTTVAPAPAGVLALERVNQTLSVAAQMVDPEGTRVALSDLAAE